MSQPVSAPTASDRTVAVDRLLTAIECADLRTLLIVVYQITGDETWLKMRPKRDVNLIATEDAGLSPAEQDKIRKAAFAILANEPSPVPSVQILDDEMMLKLMSICLGEDVPAEYAPLMREEIGFSTRDYQWRSRPATIEMTPVLIVGVGVSGIALAARLGRLGIPYQIIERHADVGGVWLENRYPGVGVDTPNHSYSYSFGSRYPWSRYFSTRDEIADYLGKMVDECEIREHIRFQTEVVRANWNEEQKRWVVTVRDANGEQDLSTSTLVTAIGQFGLPSIPEIAGAESFEGQIFHSANWPEGIDTAGKKVAIIGTGASAMQIVPTIVDDVEKVTVYQRTPQWIRPIARYHDSIGPAQWLLDHVPLYAAWFRFTMWWRYGDGLLALLRKDPKWPHPERSVNKRNDRHREEMLAHIHRELGDRTDLIAKCEPDYPPFGKRILLDNGWYQAIKKPQAELVSDPVAAITPTGICTTDGVERPADMIVYATGFQITRMAARLNISGRGGVNLTTVWDDDDPQAYLGITVPGFPNLFMMQGPNTGLGHGGSAIFQAESQARYISGLIVRMIEEGIATVDVKPEALNEFIANVDAEHEQLIWTHPGVSTYYRNSRGRVVSVMPFRLVDYWQMTREPDLADYSTLPS